MVIGKAGFIAWFYAVIYVEVRKACKNIKIKIMVHTLGLILIFFGIYFLFTNIPSYTSIGGLFSALIGSVIFFTPLGVETNKRR